MTDDEAVVFDLEEFEEQKFNELRPMMFYSGMVISALSLSLWWWDYSLNPALASATLKWRVLTSMVILLASSGYLYFNLPQKWYFISVIIAALTTFLSFAHISGILQLSDSHFRAGGFGRGLFMPVILAMGVGRKQILAILAASFSSQYLLVASGIYSGVSYFELSAYAVPFFIFCIIFAFFLDLLFRRIYIARKHLMAEKIKAEHATLLKNQFISLVSHDLRGPIGSIRGFMDIILERNVAPEETTDLVIHARASADSALKVIENLLNIGRLHTGTIRPEIRRFDLRLLVVEKTMRLAHRAETKGVTLVTDIPPDTFWTADESLVGQVLQNLVDNAAKFTPRGGRISVHLVDKETLCVSNTGAGIPADILHDLFKHEVKTSRVGTEGETGTGLGLPLSLDIIKAHGGDIVVKNEPGKGVAFHMHIPAPKKGSYAN